MIKHELRIDDYLFSYVERGAINTISVFKGNAWIEFRKVKKLSYKKIMENFNKIYKDLMEAEKYE